MRKQKFLKGIAIYMAFSLLFEIFYPTVAMALTGGPAQPESSAFEPVGTSDMVDLFSGDYNYNIPLMDVGGYPINIAYHSGVTMDQEASWVGLGWNINPGAINRSMRGLPDDFEGDIVKKEFNVKPNQTYGVNVGVGFSIAGFSQLSLNFSIGARYNNYTGVGFEQSANIAITAGESGKGSGTASLGIHSSSEGLDISPSVSFSAKVDKTDGVDTKLGASIGTSFNARCGLKALTVNVSISQSKELADKRTRGTANQRKLNQETSGGSSGTGSSLDFNASTYTPQVSMPMKNLAVNTSFQLGTTVFTVDGTINASGYFSEQRLAYKKQDVRAYGYLFSEEGTNLDKVLLDFNREKDGSFTKNTPALPLTNFSYDLYSVSGQGVGGMFRPFRSDLGCVYDSRCNNTSDSYSLGLEIGTAETAHAGFDITINDVRTTTGKWKAENDNDAARLLRFKNKIQEDIAYEPYYFKEAGEKSVDSYSQLYDAVGGSDPVRIELVTPGDKFSTKTNNQLIVGENATSRKTIPAANYRKVRRERNQLFSFIKRGEYANAAVDKNLSSSIYSSNNNHHIGEITTTKTDGSRYVYGIPAYNTQQREVTFCISNNNGLGDIDATIANAGLIRYTPSKDNTTGNDKGLDNYFNSTELPPYAHSYLLTAVLSADYVDVTGNGPSIDDLGNYTKFCYTKITGDYNWRVPYGKNMANFNEGLKTVQTDEQGNYLYGKKEIWILNKIETKNYVAVFTTKSRADGYDSHDENGGFGDHPTSLLKKISLYSRPDFVQNYTAGNAVPIKEVHFVYDYSLCKGVLNNYANINSGESSASPWSQDSESELSNDGGKLTLKKIYFTYGNSNKAKLNPYTFTYSSNNYNYGMKDYDKWGNYKPNNPSVILNAEYPYVDQDKTTADQYTSAWTLTQVQLPSGGKINIDYESDDYSYVQDRRAMQMFKITSIGHSAAANPTDASGVTLTGDDYLFFKLQDPIANDANANSTLFNNYLKGISNLYFRFLIDPNRFGKEYVSGYAEGIKTYGFASSSLVSGSYTYAYIQLNPVTKNDGGIPDISPISKAAIQFGRLSTTKQTYAQDNAPQTNPTHPQVADVVKAMASGQLISNVMEAFQGANAFLYVDKHLGQTIQPNKCWIRLLNPNQRKLGGGCRVKKISISDEWASMNSAGQTFSYGQEYDYTTVENGKTISSGVASYEPMVGADENPFRLPVSFTQKMKLACDYDFYMEEPFGETFFPSASVGYSKVTVKNLQRYKNNDPSQGRKVIRHATGSVVSEFYTGRDFPVFTRKTHVDAKPAKSGLLVKLLTMRARDYMTASQGFSIELNDMAGKAKATWVYAEDQAAPISGVEYNYKANGNRLDNSAIVINKNGTVENAQIGVDYDFVADMRQQKTDVINAGAQINLYGFLVAVVPVVIPPILPTFTSEKTRFRSAVVTKVINHFGLLQETIAHDLGSKVSTQNLAYDAQTGEVLLTKTKTDFNDEVYSMNYPAHLGYDRMGPGYKNVSVVLNSHSGSILSSTGKIVNNPQNILVPGDEVLIGTGYYWISKDKTTNDLYVIDRSGVHASLSGDFSIKVIRPGRRNMHTMSIGSFTSMVNPIDKNGDNVFDTQFGIFDESYRVLNSNAVEFSEVWRLFCECGLDPSAPGNPYVLGILGNWRAKKSYAFLSDRNQTKLNDNTNIRKDGTYTFFKQFWTPAGSNDWTVPTDLNSTSPNWTWTSEVTEFSPFGPELENKDALERFSAAVYGYNNTLPISVGSNTKYREIANDNFEDYDFDNCLDNHFSYKRAINPSGTGVDISKTQAHSGKRSIKVPATQRAKLTKVLDKCAPVETEGGGGGGGG